MSIEEGMFEKRPQKCIMSIEFEGKTIKFKGDCLNAQERQLRAAYKDGDKKHKALILSIRSELGCQCPCCVSVPVPVHYIDNNKIPEDIATISMNACCCDVTTIIQPYGYEIGLGCCYQEQNSNLNNSAIRAPNGAQGLISLNPMPSFKFPPGATWKGKLAIWGFLVVIATRPNIVVIRN